MKNRADAIGKPQAEKVSGLPLTGGIRGGLILHSTFFILHLRTALPADNTSNYKKAMQKKPFKARLMTLIVTLCVIATAAVLCDGKLFGIDLSSADTAQLTAESINDTLSIQPDGAVIISTKMIAKDVQGYAGPVPLSLYISKAGVVDSIVPQPNAETPSFFDRATSILSLWQGKTIDEAMTTEVDAVSGATFSSKALIANVERGLAVAKQHQQSVKAMDSVAESTDSASSAGWTVGCIASVIVVLLGAIVPLYSHNRRWHTVQQVLNVVVLGLWTGTFVSFTLFLRLFSGGISVGVIGTLAASLLVVVVALLYPLFGKPAHYCAHLCPFGSAQDLAGKLTKRKPLLPHQVVKALITFRQLLWAVLTALMMTGTWTAWMDYELFTAFIYSSASIWVIALAVVFLILSVWVPRPYCRFVCPTGSIIKM